MFSVLHALYLRTPSRQTPVPQQKEPQFTITEELEDVERPLLDETDDRPADLPIPGLREMPKRW